MDKSKRASFLKNTLPFVIIFLAFAYFGWFYVGVHHMKIMGGTPDRFISSYIDAGGKEIPFYNWPYIQETALCVVLIPSVCTAITLFLRRIIKK